MRLFIRPASEARAIEQGVKLLMDSYEKLPPHVPQDERDTPGSVVVVVFDSEDSLFAVLNAVAKVKEEAGASAVVSPGDQAA